MIAISDIDRYSDPFTITVRVEDEFSKLKNLSEQISAIFEEMREELRGLKRKRKALVAKSESWRGKPILRTIGKVDQGRHKQEGRKKKRF